MCKEYVYTARTSLCVDQVWKLLTDIQNWVDCSNVYTELRWSGFPWERGSCILGELTYPVPFRVRYVVEYASQPRVIRCIGHGLDAGFAVSTSISLRQSDNQTEITVSAYSVGIPVVHVPGGPEGFLQSWSERFLGDFTAFCDAKAAEVPGKHLPASVLATCDSESKLHRAG